VGGGSMTVPGGVKNGTNGTGNGSESCASRVIWGVEAGPGIGGGMAVVVTIAVMLGGWALL
jgi:hypothetical protein